MTRATAPPAWRLPPAAAAACAATAALILAWNRTGYWNYSDGVYAYSARAVLHGRELYGDLAAAHPPPIYYAGAAVLAVADSVWALRVALAVVACVSGWLVAACALRLTGHRATSALAGVAALLTPWAIKGDTSWVPESFAAPLILGAAALAAGRGRGAAVAAGVLAALAAAFKLAYLLPAAAVVLAARSRGPAAAAAVATLALGTALTLLVWGGDAWDGVVTAQSESGTRAAGQVLRLFGEAAWNAGPVLALAALAWRVPGVEDRRLRLTLSAAAGAATLALVSVVKVGSYHNVLVVAQLPALPLAAVTVLHAVRGPWRARLLPGALVAFMVLQSASILRSPDRPSPFPSPGGTRQLGPAGIDAVARRARSCDGLAFSGEPYLAFVAGRRMPGDQADQFIVAASVFRAQSAAAEADQPRCP